MIEMLKRWKKKLFCAFVDFQKAFDMISRAYMWQKLLQINITGICFLNCPPNVARYQVVYSNTQSTLRAISL